MLENNSYICRKMGISKIIKQPEELLNLFNDYKKWRDKNPIMVHDFIGKEGRSDYREKQRPLTMEGFEDFVAEIPNMPLSLDAYFANREGRYEEFVSICSYIRRQIRNDQINGGMVGIYNTSITQRLNNLVEKNETTVKVEQPLFGDDEE